MNTIKSIDNLFPVLLVFALAVGVQPALADLEADCREEAAEYDIHPEGIEEYVQACIESQGGIEPVNEETDSSAENEISPQDQ